MKLFSLLKAVALTGVVIFVGYETVAVVAARQITADLFSEYEHPKKIETLTLGNFSSARIDALIKVQDPDFWTHKGIDPFLPLTTTTLTQSIVKKLYFDDFQPGFAKVK
jgi:membrane carboxypeptidase/penicillin-binding protein